MMDRLVEGYEFRLFEAGCAPGSARYGLQIDLANDISDVMPYLNAVINNASYDHENHILIWREPEQAYALRPRQIRLARIEDPTSAPQTANEIIGRINKVWLGRHSITPRFTERKLPTVIDILKLLPKTNCKQCGYTTCLAFANALHKGQAQLEDCVPVSEEEYADNRQKILTLLSPD
jgi:ArsR family metal-binding transcriptional regulator